MSVLKGETDRQLEPGLELLPAKPTPPLLVAGLAQQTAQWVGSNMDGWLAPASLTSTLAASSCGAG